MVNYPKRIVEKVVELKEGENKPSFERIAWWINKDLSYEITWDEVKEIRFKKKQAAVWTIKKNSKIISDAEAKLQEKSDWGLSELAETDDKPKKYDESERHYIFYRDKEAYPVLISTVRNIWSDYSKNGANLSEKR